MVKFGKKLQREEEASETDYASSYFHYADFKKLLRVIVEAQESGLPSEQTVKRKLSNRPFFATVTEDLSKLEAKRWLQTKNKDSRVMQGKVPLLKPRLLKTYFFFLLNRETKRLNAFAEKKASELNEKRHEVDRLRRSNDCDERILVNELDKIKVRYWRLSRFCNFNRTAIYKILKKYDKLTGECTKEKYMVEVDKEYFCQHDLSVSRSRKRRRLKKALSDAGRAGLKVVKKLWRNTRTNSELADKEKSMMAFVSELQNDDSASYTSGNMISARRDLFLRVMENLGDELNLIDPDAAVALEKLKFVFIRLFGQESIRDFHSSVSSNSLSRTRGLSAIVASTAISLKRSDSSGGGRSDSERGVSDFSDDDDDDDDDDVTKIKGFEHVKKYCSSCVQNLTRSHWILKYDFKRDFCSDLIAAVVIAIMVLPQSIAYAQLAGLPSEYVVFSAFERELPQMNIKLYVTYSCHKKFIFTFRSKNKILAVHVYEYHTKTRYGIYASVYPAISYAIFNGQSRQGAIGPMSIVCLLMGAVADTRVSEDSIAERLEIIMTLSLLCGIWMFVLGLLGLESLVHFVSKPVFTGFVSACGVITALSVSKDMIGVYVKKSPRIFEIVPDLASAIPSTSLMTFFIAVISIALMMILKYTQSKSKAKSKSKSKSNSSRALKCFEFVPPILLVIVAGITIGGGLCEWNKIGHYDTFTIVESALGEGASLPAHLYQETSEVFVRSANLVVENALNVSYHATGSGSGQQSLIENRVDFAGTDVMFDDTIASQVPDLAIYPTVATAVCAVANIISDNVNLDVIVSRETLVKIFAGLITHWDDPEILRTNVNIKNLLPNERIRVCTRSDSSGTTSIFTHALYSFNRTIFQDHLGEPGNLIHWALDHVEVQGSDAIIDYVKRTPNSISYVSFDHVMRQNGTVRCLAMTAEGPEQNKTSSCLDVVEPSTASVTRSMEIAMNGAESWRNFTHGIQLMGDNVLLDSRAWPISSFTYIALRLNSSREAMSCSKREYVLAYLDWLYSDEARTYATRQGFIPLPDTYREHAINHAISNLRCQDGTRVALSNERLMRAVENMTVLNETTDVEDEDKYTYCRDVKIIGEIPVELRTPEIPSRFSMELIIDAGFITIAILLEHLSNLRRYAEQGDYIVNTKHDFLGLGASNVVASFFGSFACGAGFSRSAVNMDAGAKSQMSLFLSAFIVLGLAYSLRDVMYFLPKSVLATIIFLAVCKLVDVKDAVRTWRESKWDFVTLFVAFVSTLCVGVTMGILLAVISSLCVFIYYASRPRIVELRRIIGTVSYRAADENIYNGESRVVKSENVFILRPEAPLYFGNIDVLLTRMDFECQKRFSLASLGREKWVSLVLSFGCVGWIDSTAANALTKKIRTLRDRFTLTVCLAECNQRTMKRLNRCGVVKSIGGDAFCFSSIHLAVMAMSSSSSDSIGSKIDESLELLSSRVGSEEEEEEEGVKEDNASGRSWKEGKSENCTNDHVVELREISVLSNKSGK